MKVLAINGSPRRMGNDAYLLRTMLARAEAAGHETEFVQLSALDFRGCRSCFACKLDMEPWKSSCDCAVKDGLTPILGKIDAETDVLLVAAPIYFGGLSADTYAFFERLFFPALNYDAEHTINRKRRITSAIITTQNHDVPDPYLPLVANYKADMERLVGPCETLMAVETAQFDDYSRFVSSMFDVPRRESRRFTPQSEDVKKAAELMDRLLEQAAQG
ncbi:MAG: flavodoxin family protein [Lachnospiraceae bacterium]|nr:flavodoxin family protein [Lachnospiraceae bacterium]